MKRTPVIGGPTVVVGAAPGADLVWLESLLEQAGRIVAVDGGADACLSTGHRPDLIVGDMDSITPESLDRLTELGTAFERHPIEKDYSDLDAALDTLSREGVRQPVLTAVSGGRPDHSAAVIGSIAARPDLQAIVSEPGWTWWVLSPHHRSEVLLGPRSASFSVLAVEGPAVVTIRGAAYPLELQSMTPLSTRGLSNIVSDRTARVLVHEGTIVVMLAETTAVDTAVSP